MVLAQLVLYHLHSLDYLRQSWRHVRGVSEKTISRLERGGRAHYVTLERLALRVSRQRLLMKEHNAAAMEAWMLACQESGIVEVANFAHGLQK